MRGVDEKGWIVEKIDLKPSLAHWKDRAIKTADLDLFFKYMAGPCISHALAEDWSGINPKSIVLLKFCLLVQNTLYRASYRSRQEMQPKCIIHTKFLQISPRDATRVLVLDNREEFNHGTAVILCHFAISRYELVNTNDDTARLLSSVFILDFAILSLACSDWLFVAAHLTAFYLSADWDVWVLPGF